MPIRSIRSGRLFKRSRLLRQDRNFHLEVAALGEHVLGQSKPPSLEANVQDVESNAKLAEA